MVFVLDVNNKPLMPCSEKRARLLLKRGRAVVARMQPFTIRLNDRLAEESAFQPLTLKFDPGSQINGAAIVRETESGTLEDGPKIAVTGLFELGHRSDQIKKKLEQRSNYRRRRRSKNLRYRKPRFLNRRNKKKGWLAPSLKHRVDQIFNFTAKIQKLIPISGLAMELVRFDTQAMENPEIKGTEYQRGTLFGYEAKEYLLEKWGRKCAYCDAKDTPLQVEHIIPKAKGGSDRISNLTLACAKCNAKKGAQDIKEFLHKKPDLLKSILGKTKAPLRDVAAVNSVRWAIFNRLKDFGLPLTVGTGGLTKFNRSRFDIPKTHALDAACVGKLSEITNWIGKPVLGIKSRGRGSYQRTRVTANGFPRGYLMGTKTVFGFQTGDLVRAEVPKGKFAGIHLGRVAVRSTGSFDIQTNGGKKTVNYKYCRRLQKSDGYEYKLAKQNLDPNSSPRLKPGVSLS
jgi:5-methylcytosine-specific restriction endonuclease McrA